MPRMSSTAPSCACSIALIERFDLVQLPVLPLIVPGSRWVSGHYCDEFAEAHGKQLVVREAIGAGMPSAGVGCALSRSIVQAMADAGGGAAVRRRQPDRGL